jgi:hypothetical protein
VEHPLLPSFAIVSTAITVAMIEKIQENAPLIILQQIALIK